MSKFTDYIDVFADKTGTLAKEELKQLIISAKKDDSEFVKMQAEDIERWTVMLAAGELTPAGLKKKVVQSWMCSRNWRLSSWKSRLKLVLSVLQTAFKNM